MTTETIPTETAGAGARLRPGVRIRRRPLVESNMVSIAPLAIWRIKPGDTVRAGQVLRQVKPTTGSVYSSISAPIDGTVLRAAVPLALPTLHQP